MATANSTKRLFSLAATFGQYFRSSSTSTSTCRCNMLSQMAARSFSTTVSRESASHVGGGRIPSAFQRKLLVRAKVYASEAEIPTEVSTAKLQKAMNWFRIRMANRMVLLFLVGCAASISLGRRVRGKERLMDIGNEWIAQQEQIGREKRQNEMNNTVVTS